MLAAIDTADQQGDRYMSRSAKPLQAVNYVPNAVPEGRGNDQICSRSVSPAKRSISPCSRTAKGGDTQPTSVSLFDQGLIQILQAAVTGLEPKQLYVLA